jgi:hypothetical protein
MPVLLRGAITTKAARVFVMRVVQFFFTPLRVARLKICARSRFKNNLLKAVPQLRLIHSSIL